MKNMRLMSAALLAATGIASCNAAEFFDTSAPDRTFALGARIGMNMANNSIGGNNFIWNHDSWGTGFDMGVVADINIRDFLTIQPGFFYQSRSNSYTYIRGFSTQQEVNVGHTLNYAFNIPILVSVRFNVTDNVRWSLDLGPYFTLGLGKSDNGIHVIPEPSTKFSDGYYSIRHRGQWGFKMGTGLNIRDHYYVGIHYMAGVSNIYKSENMSGHAKAWMFTLGYDF